MSEPIASEIEAQINLYLNHPRTTGLAKTTRDLYKTILVNQLIPFCRRQNILNLTPDLIDHMEDYVNLFPWRMWHMWITSPYHRSFNEETLCA